MLRGALSPTVPHAVSHALLLLGPVVAAMVVAVAVAAGLGRKFGAPSETGRLVSLDGLRGYLALGVFVHHASMWRAYVQPGRSWFPSHPIPLYLHVGESAVTVFFLMTGFLFGAKLAEGRGRPIDWPRLYISRVLRIYPLYGVVLAVVLLIVAAVSRFQLLVPPEVLARGVLSWFHFGRPDLNGMRDTWTTISGVTWSLAYEWLFYAALPLAAVLFGARPPIRWVVAGVIGTSVWGYWLSAQFDPIHVAAFGGGVLASVVTRPARVRAALCGPVPACLAVAAVALVPIRYAEPYQWSVLMLLTAAFIVVASGNTIFGLLRSPASRLLGEISYSIYMLHGLLLFVVLRGVLGMPVAAALPPAAYWGLVVALVPVLVAGAFTTFRLVERPAIRATPHVQRWLAARSAQWRAASDGGATAASRAGRKEALPAAP